MTPAARQIARLSDNADFQKLREMFAAREEEAVQKLARQTYQVPENHTRLEWECLRSFYRGAGEIFNTVAAAADAVRNAETTTRSA